MGTIGQLYNEEANWAASVLTVLAAGNTGVPTANILTPQGVTFAPSPRIEIEVEEVGRASDQMAYANGQWYFSHRFATIRTDIVTQRTATPAQDHGAIRGRVRYLLSREAQTLVSPAVTWYVTLDVDETGSSVTVRDPEGDREDVTTFRHRIEYGILPTSVPTV
jgi:hypothetical protein